MHWRRWNGLKFNRLKKFNGVYIDGQKNYEDDFLIVIDKYIVSEKIQLLMGFAAFLLGYG